jgi:hypothetical protein
MKNIKVVAENCKVISIDDTLVVTNSEGNVIAKQEKKLTDEELIINMINETSRLINERLGIK